MSDTVPTEENPQLPLEGDMTNDERVTALVAPGLIVSCALAESRLQGALAETVTRSCELTAFVERVTDTD